MWGAAPRLRIAFVTVAVGGCLFAAGPAGSAVDAAAAAPSITGVSPSSGAVGSQVTITGTGFHNVEFVSYYDYRTTFTVVSPTEITATVPAGTPSPGRWRVRTAAGLAVHDPLFTVTTSPPVISSVSPMSGPAGSTVTITGSNFGAATLVSFYDYATSFTIVSPTQITATVPAGTPSPGRWRVRNAAGTGVHDPLFSVTVGAATVTSVSPLQGPVGSTVTLTGANFGLVDQVTFYDFPATFTVLSETQIRATVPSGTPSPGRWRVVTSGVKSVYDAHFTIGPDITAPTSPQSLRITGTTTTSIGVAWNSSSDNVAVTAYGRYRNDALLSSGTGTTFNFTGLACGTTYTLAIDAIDRAGNRSSAAQITGATASCATDTQSPSVPQGLHTASTTQTTATLAWNASSDNVGVTGYHMYRDNLRVASTPNLTYTFTGLTCGTLYALALEAFDAAGNVSYRPEAVAMVSTNACSADTQPPTTPSGLARTAATDTSISISWTASSDNVAVAGYGRYVGTALASSGAGTTYTFTGLTCNTAYSLGIDAYDAAGNRSGRATLSATTAACPAAPPPSPPPPAGAANLWVDTNGGSCTRTSGGAYVDAQACGSFAAAYAAAASGDLVRVRPGTYPAQFFAGGVGASQGRGSKTLTFLGEAGNIVRQLHFGSSGLTFDGIRIDSGGVKTSGAAFENSGSSFVFKNGSIGNVLDEKGAMISGPSMVFDNVLFHDVVLRGAGVHLECIMALWNQDMVIRNSTFRNCGIMDASIGIGDWWQPAPPPYSRVTLENNFFGNSRTDGGACCAAYSLALWATKIPSGSDYGVLDQWRIVRNHFEAGSGVIVRPRDNGTSVICGNTGSVPSSTWSRACT